MIVCERPCESVTHDTDSPCSCVDCQLIDILWGDPLLNPWERRFVDNLSRWGWERQYSPKQHDKLVEVYERIRAIRLSPRG